MPAQQAAIDAAYQTAVGKIADGAPKTSGIEVGERVNIPEDLIPADARVEIDAKMAAGYFTPGPVPGAEDLKRIKGRGLDG